MHIDTANYILFEVHQMPCETVVDLWFYVALVLFWDCGAYFRMSCMIFYCNTQKVHVTKGKRNLSVKFSAWMLYFWWKWPIYFYPISSDADPMRWRRNNFSNQVHTNSSILRGGCSKKGKVWPSTKPPFCHLRSSQSRKFWWLVRLWNLGFWIRINRLRSGLEHTF